MLPSPRRSALFRAHVRAGARLAALLAGLTALPALSPAVGHPAAAQTLGDPGFAHTVARQRVEALVRVRSEVAFRFRTLADSAGALASRGYPAGLGRLAALVELSDSVVLLGDELRAAARDAETERLRLIRNLEARADSLRRTLATSGPPRAADTAARLADTEARIETLGRRGDPVEAMGSAVAPNPPMPPGPAHSALLRVVEDERKRRIAAEAVAEETRLFLGDLRLFDETGMPPSTRSESGGDPGTSCPITACSAAPGDLPMEHAGLDADRTGAMDGDRVLTAASLGRLRDALLTDTGETPSRRSPTAGPGPVTREVGVGIGGVGFRARDEARAGPSVRTTASLLVERDLGGAGRLTLEPRVGVRSLHLTPATSVEMAAEVGETLAGKVGPRRMPWRVTAWQKGRLLVDPPLLPAYLEPGRGEAGVAARLAVPLAAGWAVEAEGGGDAVRYEPDAWRVLDRRGVRGALALARAGGTGALRISAVVSHHDFTDEDADGRVDTRTGLGAEWTREGPLTIRLSAGVGWNESRLPAHDFRADRAAVVVSARHGSSTLQAYAALARQSYRNPGAADGGVAPSDEDMGSVLVARLVRPLGAGRALTLSAEWSRSETGFSGDRYRRLGFGAGVGFRRPGSG